MTALPVGYRAYLLRLWRTPEAHWRASLEDPHTGERRAFATLVQLLVFLEEEEPLEKTSDDSAPGKIQNSNQASVPLPSSSHSAVWRQSGPVNEEE